MIEVEKNSEAFRRPGPRHIKTHEQVGIDVPILLLNGFKICSQEGRKTDRSREQTKGVTLPKWGWCPRFESPLSCQAVDRGRLPVYHHRSPSIQAKPFLEVIGHDHVDFFKLETDRLKAWMRSQELIPEVTALVIKAKPG